MKQHLKHAAVAANGYRWRMRALGPNPPRFSGAYPTRAAALDAQSGSAPVGYDHDDVADVSFAQMCQVASWDYPVLYWLNRLLGPQSRVLDAGGHMGTKYIAFEPYLTNAPKGWTVLDLPAIVAAAQDRQAKGQIPASISFTSDPAQAGAADILLASGLLQYLDTPLRRFVDSLPTRPDHILLNKVALRDGPTLFTMEQIGPAKVPYQIRNRADFEAEIAAMGYELTDGWAIPGLSHTIATHPLEGKSQSRGYALRRL